MRRPRRVLGYVRVSGAEQERHGTSLQAQEEEIRRHCAQEGYPEPDIRVEAESAGAEKLARRRVLRGLLDDARSGDLVIVSKQDRWSRDTLFYLQSTRELTERGVRFFSIAERFDPDTSEGRFAATLMAAVAEQERDRIKARTVGRRQQLRDEGRYVEGLPPLGYRRGEGNILQVVPEAAAAVRGAFDRCARGHSLRDVVQGIQADFGIYRDKQVWHRILRSRHYLGEVKTSRGEWIPSHEPIVPLRLWRRAQAGLAKRRLGGRKPSDKARTHTWLLRDVAHCAMCGAKMGAAYGQNRDGTPVDYYACGARLRHKSCDARYVRVDVVEPAASALVLARLRQLRRELSRARSPVAPQRPDFDVQRTKLERRRDRLVDLAADGAISHTVARQRLAAVADDLADLDERQATHDALVAATRPKERAASLRSVKAIERRWGRCEPPERRDIVNKMAESADLERGTEPVFRWRSVPK